MSGPLPVAFFLCLAGTTICGAAALWIVYRLLRRARWRERLRGLPAAQHASTVVEVPFVLLLLVQLSLLTWQLGLMSAAHLVMDYAAFAAVRSAVVILPETDGEEGANELATRVWPPRTAGSGTGSSKGDEIRQAAVFVCYPISGLYSVDYFETEAARQVLETCLPDLFGMDADERSRLQWALGEVLDAEGWIQRILPDQGAIEYLNRYYYAYRNTYVRLANTGALRGGTTITVEVRHDFKLSVPFAAVIFSSGKKEGIGHYVTLTASASMLNEGYAEQDMESGE